jgi:hypothetical protein
MGFKLEADDGEEDDCKPKVDELFEADEEEADEEEEELLPLEEIVEGEEEEVVMDDVVEAREDEVVELETLTGSARERESNSIPPE